MNSFATAILDNMFTVKTGNVEFFNVFGSKIQRSLFAFVDENDLPMLEDIIEELPQKKQNTCVVKMRDKNGEPILMLLKMSIVMVSEQEFIEAYFIDILHNEQLYNEAVEKYRISERHLMNMEMLCFEYSPNTRTINIYMYSLNQTVSIFNGDFYEWKHNALDSNYIPEDQIETFNAFCFDIESCKESFTYKLKSKLFTKGEMVEENIIRCSSLTTILGNTFITGTVASVVNNSTLGVENSYIRTYKDPMTGVLNKTSVVRFIKNRITNLKPNESIVIAILDLDNFKLVNDTFGHLYGDKVIIKFANIISSTIGGRGITGRFGGDEFMIMLEGIKDEMDLRSVLRAIRTSVETEFRDIGNNISLTTSIGAATFPKDAKNYDELFTKADYCLYLSKMRGKNRYVMFDYMIKEHHYLNDKLMLKKDHSSLDRIAYALHVIDMILTNAKPPIFDILSAVGERYNLGRIRIYTGSDLELKYNWGKPTEEIEFECIYEDFYLDAFTENKNFVINYISNIEANYPTVYKHLCASGTQAAVQYLMGNKQHVHGLISFEMIDSTNHWSDDAIYSFTIIGHLLETMAFDKGLL